MESVSAAETINDFVAASFSLLEINIGGITAENIFFILGQPEFDPKLPSKQMKSLEQCGSIAKANVDRNRDLIWHSFYAYFFWT